MFGTHYLHLYGETYQCTKIGVWYICIYVVLLIVDKYTDLRVKVVKGTPSLVLHIRAEPSVDVEAKNSESRLEHGIT